MASPLRIAADANGWTGSPESARYGDIEIRLSVTDTTAAELPATGTMRGTAIDTFSLISFPNPSQVAISGTAGEQEAVLTGTYFVQLQAAFGTVSGRLVYTDNQRGEMTCTSGNWFLYPIAR